jgi:hypothetical protein
MKPDTARRKPSDRKLLDLFGKLAPDQQDRLIEFAELLAGDAPSAGGDPRVLPGPAGETVTMAIRRLARSYSMLDRRKLMGEASRLMGQHALEGRAAHEVIAELEAVFAQHFQRHKVQDTRHKGRQ